MCTQDVWLPSANTNLYAYQGDGSVPYVQYKTCGESGDDLSPESPTQAEFLPLACLISQSLAITNHQYLLKMVVARYNTRSFT